MPDTDSLRQKFRALHESGCFVIPNPWDAGSARYLQSLGFVALATTSAGVAFSHGVADSEIDRDTVLANAAAIVCAVGIPVNTDFQAGYADTPEGVAANVQLCAATGVAGLSIEDATGDPANPLYSRAEALERFRAAQRALAGTGLVLTARSECFLTGHVDPLAEAIARLETFAAEGADVLYAPGVSKPDDIRAIVRAVSPKPVNFLMSKNLGLSVADLAEMGVRRISVGSTLARTAWTGFLESARQIADRGTFTSFDGTVPFAEINGFFQRFISKTR